MWTKIIKNYVAKSSLELYFFSDQAIENINKHHDRDKLQFQLLKW